MKRINQGLIVEGRSDPAILSIPRWTAGKQYIQDDLVREGDTLYFCKNDHLSSDFIPELSNWIPVVAEGASAGATIQIDPPEPSLLDLDPLVPVWRHGDSITTGDIGYIHDYCKDQPDSMTRLNPREMVFKVRALKDFTVDINRGSGTYTKDVYLWLKGDGVAGELHYVNGDFEILEEYFLDAGPSGNATRLNAQNIADDQYWLRPSWSDQSGDTNHSHARFHQIIYVDWENTRPGAFDRPHIQMNGNTTEFRPTDFPKKSFHYNSKIVIVHHNLPSETSLTWELGAAPLYSATWPLYFTNAEPGMCSPCEGNMWLHMDGTESSYYIYEITFDPDNERRAVVQTYPVIPPVTVP